MSTSSAHHHHPGQGILKRWGKALLLLRGKARMEQDCPGLLVERFGMRDYSVLQIAES
jgi:hypothetical protein